MTEVEQERKRITDIIHNRMYVINDIIDTCANNEIKVPDVLFDQLYDLLLVLREIRKDQNT